jgi:hypothetical protein
VIPGACNLGWCWENPLPAGVDLHAVFGEGPGDVWTGGEAGLLFHFQDGSVTTFTLPHTRTGVIRGIADDRGGHVVAVSDDGHISTFDGGSWATVDLSPQSYRFVFAPGPGLPVFVAGTNPLASGPFVGQLDPTALTVATLMVSASPSAQIVGMSGNDQNVWLALDDGTVFAVSVAGQITLGIPSVPADAGLTSFCAQSDGGLWAASSGGQAGFFYSSGTWSSFALPEGNVGATCSDNGALLVGNPGAPPLTPTLIYRCSAGACAPETVDAGFPYPQGYQRRFPASLLAASSRVGSAWACGEGGGVFESTGGGPWQSLTSGPREGLWDTWVDSDGGGWATGQNGIILRRQQSAWFPYPATTFLENDVYFVQPYPAGGYLFLMALGTRTLQDAQSSFQIGPELFDDGGLYGGSFSRAIDGPVDNLWLMDEGGGNGVGTVLKWQGNAFIVAQQFPGTILDAVFATDAGTFWAAGAYGAVMHFDGAAFQPVTVPGATGTDKFNAVVGTSDTDVYLVSTTALYHHLDDGGWDAPVSLAPYFHPFGSPNAVLDPARGTLWVVSLAPGAVATTLLAFGDAGVTATPFEFHAPLNHLRLRDGVLWLAGHGGDVLRYTPP